MQLGIFSKTFDGTEPQAVLGAVRAAGFAACRHVRNGGRSLIVTM